MQRLDPQEFREYLNFSRSNLTRPDGYEPDSGDFPELVRAAHETRLVEFLVKQIFNALETVGPESAVASCWFSGFQMGREFESRKREAVTLASLIKP
jgi:hypothetical protein